MASQPQHTITQFMGVLRAHELPVSTAESLEAMEAIRLVGYSNRERLREALAAVVCKRNEQRAVYERCFDRFFAVKASKPENKTKEKSSADDAHAPEPDFSATDSLQDWLRNSPFAHNSLLQALINGDRALRDTLLAQAATEVGLDTIEVFTQIGPLTQKLLREVGVNSLDQALSELNAGNNPLGHQLEHARQQLRGAAREFVERAHLLHGEQASKRLRTENIGRTRLNWLSPNEMAPMERLIRKMARKLAGRHNRRKRTFRRGQLDVSNTLYRNLGHDGVPFYTRWKKVKKERPDVYVICDVSGSVAPFARFLLTFLYSLNDVLPRVRSFAFSYDMGEVSECFQGKPANEAVADVMNQWGAGSTRYAEMLDQFMAECGEQLSRQSTVIILGDARNNYGASNVATLRKIHDRVNRVLWLNPEGLHNWNTDDSIMHTYQAACHQVAECGSLKQLERAVSQLLKSIC